MSRVRGANRLVTSVELPGGLIAEQAHRDIEQRQVAVHPYPLAPGSVDAGDQGEGRDETTAVVDQAESRLGRRGVRLPCQAHPAREPLQDVVVGGLSSTWSVLAEARQRAAHDSGVDDGKLAVGQAQLFGDVAAQVGVDRIRNPDQVVQDIAPSRRREVQREALLVAVEGFIEEAVLALLVRHHIAAHVTARARVLDLDDLGAQVSQLQTPERTRAVLFDCHHAHVLEWQHQHSLRRRESIASYVARKCTRWYSISRPARLGSRCSTASRILACSRMTRSQNSLLALSRRKRVCMTLKSGSVTT